MKADEIKLLEFMGQNKKTFYIPVYQRNYDWNKLHCRRLFDDITDIIERDKTSHFLGTVVYVVTEADATYSELIIIDGQQRITTMMLLLKALHDSTENEDIKTEIFEDYLINKRADDKFRLKLKTIQNDDGVFKNIIESKTIDTHSNLKTNFEYFLQLIRESKHSADSIFLALNRLQIVHIKLDDKDNPQLIFESLNSTGLDLTQADLIRNFLLMGHSYENQTHYYFDYWEPIERLLPNNQISSFIRDYLTYKTGEIPNQEKVFAYFKKYFNYNGFDKDDIETLLKALKIYATWYSWFYYNNSPNKEVNKRLSEIARIKSTVIYPYLLDLFARCYQLKSLSESELIKILDVLISYLFRRYLCDIPTNALNKVFKSLSKEIKGNWISDLSYLDNLKVALLRKKSSAIFPHNELLKQTVLAKNSYAFKHKKYLFEKLELNNNKETLDFSELTIEHIMPQTLTDKWRADLGKNYNDIYERYLHNIGNLTLTGYNPELSNNSFDEKRKILSGSNIYTNRMLSDYEAWNVEEILARAKKLIDNIIEVWEMPKLSKEYLDKDIDLVNGEIDLFEEVDVTGRTPYELVILGETFSITSWKAFFIKVCEFFYDYSPREFLDLRNHPDFTGRNRVIISEKENDTGKSYKMDESLYLQVNLSANSSLYYSKLVADKFDDEFGSEISYKIR